MEIEISCHDIAAKYNLNIWLFLNAVFFYFHTCSKHLLFSIVVEHHFSFILFYVQNGINLPFWAYCAYTEFKTTIISSLLTHCTAKQYKFTHVAVFIVSSFTHQPRIILYFDLFTILDQYLILCKCILYIHKLLSHLPSKICLVYCCSTKIMW